MAVTKIGKYRCLTCQLAWRADSVWCYCVLCFFIYKRYYSGVLNCLQWEFDLTNLVITNDILRPSNSKIYGKKSRYSITKHSYVVGNISWPFFISRYHCNCFISIGKYPKRLQENGRLRVYFNKNLNSMTTRFRKTMVTSRCLILKRNLGDPFAIYNRNRLLSRTCRAALFKARLS